MERERLDRPRWRRSSYSGTDGGNCVEAATAADAVLIRDSKDPDGPHLAFGRQAWEAFAAAVTVTSAAHRG
jgi:Domain of unknown function (DUF397)